MPKQEGKRTRQGKPKLSAEVNAAKKAKGNGQDNVAWNAKTGRQDNAEGNTEDKKKGKRYSEKPETRRMQKEKNRQPSGHHEVQFRALGAPCCAMLWNG